MVPYALNPRTPPLRYIRFRGFDFANCAEIELRTVRVRRGFVLLVK